MNILGMLNGNNRKVRRLAEKKAELRAVRAEHSNLVRTRHKRRAIQSMLYANMGGSNVTTGEKFPGGLSNSGMTRIFDHRGIRRNIRDAMYDSPAARSIASRFADTTVETGLKPKFEPQIEITGQTQEEAAAWGRTASLMFDNYLRSKQSSIDGINNGYQNQHLYSFMQQRDNDNYVRFHYSRSQELISPVQIQFLDSDQLSGFCYTSTNGLQKGLNGGIEYDKNGREKSYTFIVFNEKDNTAHDVTIPAVGSRSGRRYMIHGFRPDFCGQKQGYALYSHLLQEFEDLTTLQTAHVQKAINQSSFGFYTKPSDDAPASAGVDDFANQKADLVDQFLKDTADTTGVTTEEAISLSYNVMPEFSIRQPGTLWNTSLAAGEDMRAVEQTAPADKFAEFVESLITNMSASTGMPIEVLLMKFGQNYSASRATLVLFWRIVNIWRAEMEADFLNPWAEAWLSEEIASGRIKAPGWSDPRIRAAWLNIRWIGSSVPTIDPKKESEGDMNRVILGHETLDDGALRYNGSDGQRNREQLAKQLAELAPVPWASGAASAGGDEDEEDEEEPDDNEDE